LRLPLTAVLNVQSVSPLDIEITINGFSGVTTDQEQAIETAITNHLENVRPFVPSIDVASEQNDTFSINNIISLVLQAVPGAVFGSVDLVVDGNTVPSYQFENGEIPFLDSITYP
jgi:hypothetical protein